MALTRCAGCDNPLTDSDVDSGRCPACGQSVGYTRPAAPAWSGSGGLALDTPWSAAPRSATTSSLLGWATIRTSLSLAVAGTLLLTVTSVVLVLTTLALQAPRPSFEFIEMLTPLIGLGAVAGTVLALVAVALGGVVPGEAGARGWIIACWAAVFLAFCLAALLVFAAAQNLKVQRENNDAFSRWSEQQFNQQFGQFGPVQQAPPPTPRPLPWGEMPLRYLRIGIFALAWLGNCFYVLFLAKLAWHLRQTWLTVAYGLFWVVSGGVNALLLASIFLSMERHLFELSRGEFFTKVWPWILTCLGLIVGGGFVVLALFLRATVVKHVYSSAK
jgi:hypothetical protein